MIDWTDVVIACVSLLFTAIIIPLVRAGFVWLTGKAKNEAILTALKEAEKIADNVVASLQASVVDEMKAKSADGKLTWEEIAELSERAFNMFISDISWQTRDTLLANADDIEKYVRNLIEARLAEFKK